ncbi:MAG: hypothetical protein K2O65_04070 [Lachnospiraceae bacterium]|nr:hypothetical protein [Lachnospiraceae bacterium]
MSMEVSSNYKNDYLERLQEGKDKAKEIGKEQDARNKSESIPVPKDEYISSEQSGRRPSGLYHMGKDENGNPKVMYDDPKKAGGADGNGKLGVRTNGPEKDKESEQPKVKSGSRKDDAEEVTGNTDAVDREIKKLKKQKQQLEQQIKAASGDEEKTKELEKKLAQVESELSQKDNDTYRRQHAVITSRA